MIKNAYKRQGFGCQYTSCIAQMLFFYAAILYVDDTGLLLRAKTPSSSRVNEKFFAEIQEAIDAWGGLVLASGGALKPKKCHVSISINSYKFVNVVAKVRKKRELHSRFAMVHVRQ